MESQWYFDARELFSTEATALAVGSDVGEYGGDVGEYGGEVGEYGGEGVGDASLVVLRTTLLPVAGNAVTSDAMGATGRAVLGTVGGEGGGDGVLPFLLTVLPAPEPGACEAACSSLRVLLASSRSVCARCGRIHSSSDIFADALPP